MNLTEGGEKKEQEEMKYINLNTFLFSLLSAIICFFLFPVTMEMSYCEELLPNRGYGFPFIYLIDDPTTSLYKVIDLNSFLIDLGIYIAFFFAVITTFFSIIKKQIIFGKKTFITLGIIAFIAIAAVIPIIYFSSFSEIEYHPLYNTKKFSISFL